jgi:hypothetical protein
VSITEKTITFTCPSCGHTAKRHTVIKEIADGKKPLCEECGKEIPIDADVLARIEELLRRLGLAETPADPSAVKKKVFSVDVKTSVDLGKTPLPGRNVPAAGAPAQAGPNVIEPKRGCLGVMAALALAVPTAAALICALL